MVPGGVDHVFDGNVADVALVCLRAAWPEAIVVGSPQEMFVYRDEVAREAWRRLGATRENAHTMVHIVLGSKTTTIVTAQDPQETP